MATERDTAPEPAQVPICSMVVDWPDAHAYQAEILLLTLEAMAGVPPERVAVQCTERVDPDVVAAFRRRGHAVPVIEPYLDGAYCNKIAQLDHLVDHADEAGVFLMDLDVAVLTPLALPDRGAIRGKVVDGSNPPLATVERIFAAAGVPVPALVPCDWEGRGETVATNLNGGFLYIPRPLLAPLRQAWRRWAEWLHGSPELFGSAAESKHTDQLSFALALAADGFDWRPLPSNWNFPGGHDRRPQLFDRDQPVRVLHYRSWSLDEAGLIRLAYRESGDLDTAVERVNRLVAERALVFHERYRRGRARDAVAEVPLLEPELFSAGFVARARRGGDRRRLVLHAGAPKTGTSSLQWHLASHRQALAAEGCWFPPPTLSPEPKHQPLSAALRRGDVAGFVRYVESALDGMPEHTHTIVLSTEGVYNHWSDYPPQAKGALRRLAALFDFELCVWFREPLAFAAALYGQYLANPPTDGADAAVQGRDISFGEAMADGWFRGHLDFLGFHLEASMLFGAGRVRALPFHGDTVAAFLDDYSIAAAPRQAPRRNRSLNRVGIAGLRLTNRLDLAEPARRRAVAVVRRIDRALGVLSPPFRPGAGDRAEVALASERGWKALQPVLSSSRRRRRPLRGRKVFCIGFHKTGTKSLGAALTALGYRVVGPSGARDPGVARHALGEALALATEYDAFNDNPWALLYRELDAAFPGSRFVLTRRDTGRWMASVLRHFGADQTPMRTWIYGHGAPLGNEGAYRARYEEHNEAVEAWFAGREDLLVMDLERGDGWGELCGFLGEAVPEAPFPHLNRDMRPE